MKRALLLFLVCNCLSVPVEGQKTCSCKKAPASETTRPGANEIITWELSRPYRFFHGTVTVSGSQSLENVLVEVFPDRRKASVEKESKRLVACLTDKLGRYCFNKLRKGRYRVLFSLDGGWKHSEVYIRIDPDNRKAGKKPFEMTLEVGT